MGEKKLSYTPWENPKRFFYIYQHLKDWGILGFFFRPSPVFDLHKYMYVFNVCL